MNTTGAQFPAHTDSRHLRIASVIASLVAYTKQRQEIQLADQIAGIYVANFDRVVKFWPDAATFEDFIAEHCGWSEPRLMTWERYVWEMRQHPRTIYVPFTRWHLQFPRRHSSMGRMFTRSEDLKLVYLLAEQMSPYKVNSFDRVVCMITPELFLLATSRADNIALAQQIKASGLRVDQLKDEATRPLESPDKLMF